MFENRGQLLAGSKHTRDGGDGLSPPIVWTGAPAGTKKSLAVIMHHYPGNKVECVDNSSHYWLVWNIPAYTVSLDRRNTESVSKETKIKGISATRRHVQQVM